MKDSDVALCLFGVFAVKEETLTPDSIESCGKNLIVVDQSRFASICDYEQWREGKNYICHENGKLVYIDVDKIVDLDPNSPEAAAIKADWLKANASKINFYESYRYIEDSHRETDEIVLAEINQNATFKAITLQQIKAAIKDQGGDFDDDQYNHYLSFGFSQNGVIATLHPAFKFNSNHFSIPLFRAIVQINGIGNSDEILLGERVKSGINGAAVVKSYIKYKKNIYNFSDEPKLWARPAPQNRGSKNGTCINLDEYLKIQSQLEKAEWLRQKGKDVCPETLDIYLKKVHAIGPCVDVTIMGKEFGIKCSDLKKITGSKDYDLYIAFKYDKDEITGFDLLAMFDPQNSCYSARFLNFLMKNLNDDDKVAFIPAQVNKKRTVIIHVKGYSHPFYNFSQEPALT